MIRARFLAIRPWRRFRGRGMSKRKNRTNRAAAALGLNPYGWGNGGTRKRPREVRTPVGQMEKLSQPNYKGNFGGMQDEKNG